MITKWKLANFKSVRRQTELSLGPLTILAGPNSSGKSAVLQSMLLISQTAATVPDAKARSRFSAPQEAPAGVARARRPAAAVPQARPALDPLGRGAH